MYLLYRLQSSQILEYIHLLAKVHVCPYFLYVMVHMNIQLPAEMLAWTSVKIAIFMVTMTEEGAAGAPEMPSAAWFTLIFLCGESNVWRK